MDNVDIAKVTDFLSYAKKKSILNPNSARLRITACNAILPLLESDERNVPFVRENLDTILNRLRNSNPNVTGETLGTYRSRIKSSLEDYEAWNADSIGWERSLKTKGRGKEERAASTPKPNANREPVEKVAQKAETSRAEAGPKDGREISVRLRPGFDLKMWMPEEGISKKEFTRLGFLLLGHVYDLDDDITGRPQWPAVLKDAR